MEKVRAMTTDFKTQTICLGIDEAGRGPVLGAMVYACCYFDIENSDFLKKTFRFDDSKKLSEKQRESIFNKMEESQNILG
jgi:ribonuclease H2 subunit A